MPDFDINLNVKDGRAAQQISNINRALTTTEATANRVRGVFRGLFAGFGVAIAIRQILSLSDATVSIENRLKLATNSTEDLNSAFDRLSDIARRTRSPLEESVGLFQKATQAQSELGASTEEIFKFIEATGSALAIQGGAANTARGALIQLSQAIGATVVRAEEFNSILEGALPLAQAAARGIEEAGGSVAKLRQLIIAGEISSKEFFDAIVSQSEFLREQFDKTSATVSQAFIIMRNEAITLFREFNTATGFTTALANSIVFVADNLAQFLAGGATAIALAAVGTAIGLITRAVIGLSIALVTNPIGLIATAFSLLISAIPIAAGLIVAFSDSILVNIGSTAVPLMDVLLELWDRLVAVLFVAKDNVTEVGAAFQGLNTGFDIRAFVENIVVGFIQFRVTVVNALDRIVAGFKIMGINIQIVWQQALQGMWGKLEAFVNDVIGKLNQLNNELPNRLKFDPIPMRNYTSQFTAEIVRLENEAIRVANEFRESFRGQMGEATFIALAKIDEFFEAVKARAAARAAGLELTIPIAVTGPEGTGTTVTSGSGSGSGKGGGGGGGSQTSFADVVAEYEKGIQALGKLGQEQRIYNEVLRAADRIGRDLTETEAAQITELVKKTEVLQKASDIYDQLNGRVDDYILTQQALNDLLSRGVINQNEADFALSQSQLVQDLSGVDQSLGGKFAYQDQLQGVRDYVNERTIILQQARETDLINEEQYQDRLTALTAASQREILNIELDRWSMAIGSAQNSIGVLLDAAETYAGKQSGIYKGLFIAQKAFAIAEATVNTFRAISNALAAPFPPPIPQTLAAAAAVAGGAQVAAIVASTISGLKDGGRVRGPGGPRDDAAGLFALSNDEFVVNAAAAKRNMPLLEAINRGMKPLQGMSNGGLVSARTSLSNAGSADIAAASRTAPSSTNVNNDVQVPVNVINVSSREEALSAVGSQQGGEIIINQINDNARQIRNVLGLEN